MQQRRRLPVTYDTRTTFRRLRARATFVAATQFRRSYFGRQVRRADRRQPLTWASVPEDYDVQIRELRRARGVEPGTISHPGGRGAESRCLSMGGAQTHALAPVLATTRRAPRARRQPLGAPFARSNGSGTPSTMRTVSTLTGRSGGSLRSEHADGRTINGSSACSPRWSRAPVGALVCKTVPAREAPAPRYVRVPAPL